MNRGWTPKIMAETGESTAPLSNGVPSASYTGGNLAFERLRVRRRQAGIDQYRGGDPEAPFVGDPVEEFEAEAADALNYLAEIALSGRIKVEDAMEVDHWIRSALRTLWASLGR